MQQPSNGKLKISPHRWVDNLDLTTMVRETRIGRLQFVNVLYALPCAISGDLGIWCVRLCASCCIHFGRSYLRGRRDYSILTLDLSRKFFFVLFVIGSLTVVL